MVSFLVFVMILKLLFIMLFIFKSQYDTNNNNLIVYIASIKCTQGHNKLIKKQLNKQQQQKDND